ncbi:LAMI_0A06832g1_1 [Lachancea mirantina]|uniref:LAMI_0A06832g1_1 n=1 Tax=Lachancea mirantina TaxID=1230905 RepID=A0A1G4IQD8_9SACH|nr:LAMI_0A06832g1_1 [Lachancea mirantina]
MPEKIHVSAKGAFLDPDGNEIVLRGVNFDSSAKNPVKPTSTSHSPLTSGFYDDASEVSYEDNLTKIEELAVHLVRLKSLGYNCIRFPLTWEALEHEGPQVYDFGYMDYLIEVFRQIQEVGGIYVYLDPHQDVWSRFTGGSGAPLWSLHCAGLEPNRFASTEAAILHNFYIDPATGEEREPYPKMLWPTNYNRLAAQTMFTLFFGGKQIAPKCVVNGQNIQDYLQDRFIEAILTFYARLIKKAPELVEKNCVIGLETINEPSCGYFCDPDLSQIPKSRKLKRGTTPSGFQSFMLGEGIATEVPTYEISIFGPRKTGTKLIDPQGESAWLSKEERNQIDKVHGWIRSDEWEAGKCIWRLHGVWEFSQDGNPRMLKPDYFYHINGESTEFTIREFTNTLFVDFYAKYRAGVRKICQESLIFLQPPTLQEPPKLKDSELIDKRTVYACHFYDGMSLMFKTWNRYYNVDTLGIMRGKYKNPVFSIVFGENNIKKCFRRQLYEMAVEGKEFLGQGVPVFFTEIGMPFDMDNKSAYKDGVYSSQSSALDALGFALEGNNLSFSLWCYCHQNNHKWGDVWNNEDFSIWSQDDADRPLKSRPTVDSSYKMPNSNDANSSEMDFSGFRALDAIMRPFPVKIHGQFLEAEFDLTKAVYALHIHGKANSGMENGSVETFSLICLPQCHFPMKSVTVKSSSGRFSYDTETQLLKWYHDPGRQEIVIEKVQTNDEDFAEPGGSDDCKIT